MLADGFLSRLADDHYSYVVSAPQHNSLGAFLIGAGVIVGISLVVLVAVWLKGLPDG